jgi:hypothetical protein
MRDPERSAAEDWFVVERWQEFRGERRANLLRCVGIACFYAVELVHFHAGGVDASFHSSVTILAAAWALTGAALLLLLRARHFPPSLKFAATAADLFYLTLLLTLADGPRSPLLVGYFLIVVLAALRFNLSLVRTATAGAAFGYLIVLAQARWLRPELRVPRYQEAIFLIALVLCGVLLGQIVRRAREMAEDYAARLRP